MGNKQNELEKEGFKPLLTYEEAIGYAVGGVLRDKDGVSAAAKMCEIITTLSNENQSLLSYLQEMYLDVLLIIQLINPSYSVCGYYTTRNSYVISHDKS